MAATDQITTPQQPQMDENEQNELKYLEFVQASTIQAVLCAFKLYDYAKDNLGPLKPSVQSVEGTVKAVIGPVYDKYHGVPFEVLKFVDRKVDESATKIDSYVPHVVKQLSVNAISAAQKAPVAARSVASEIKTAGVMGTASGLAKTLYTKYERAAKGLYSKYEPVAEQYAASAWRIVHSLPLVPRMAEAVAPTASFYTEKYNQTVKLNAKKGYKVASILPLVPTDKIAKVLSNGKDVQLNAEKGYKVASISPLVPTDKNVKVLNNSKDVQLNAEKGYKVASISPVVPTDKNAKVLSNSKDGRVISN